MKLPLLLLISHLVGAFIFDPRPRDNGTSPAVIVRQLDREKEHRETDCEHHQHEMEKCLEHCQKRHLRWY